MRILFISRAYPPIVGGIESQNYELSVWLAKYAETRTVANRHGRLFLPLFAPYALCIALWNARSYDIVLLGDGTIGLIGWLIKIFSKIPVVSIVHGLDINWGSKSLGVWYEKILISIYQSLWVRRFLPSLDGLIAVGNETIRQGIIRGIPEVKFTFIPNGVDTEKHFGPASRLGGPHDRSELEGILGLDLSGKHVLLTSGRLAKRKGVAWFVRNVMPKLPENILYVVAGDGVDRENIEHARAEAGMIDRVRMLGYVSDEVRDTLLNTCDLFIQPNIKVEGDMEGFGISVIEAASCELPVIASALEGLKDAIKDGENGRLVETEDADRYAAVITELLADPSALDDFRKRVRRYVVDHYSWERVSKLYIDTLEKIARI